MRGFIVKFKDGSKKGYTTLSAIFEENSSEDIGVSKYTLDRFPFDQSVYENDKCTIETLVFKTRGDIIRERKNLM